jgi:hypothetical protein
MGAQAVLAAVQIGTTLYQGAQAKKAGDKAARAAQRAGEFNAKIIERDIDLFEKQRKIVNAQFAVDQKRSRDIFERDVQGAVRSGFAFAGVDMSMGTPINVLRQNAREFDYEQKVAAFNNEVANMQINDAQEEARLNAELSRMEGGMAAASARAKGTASLISSVGKAAGTAYETRLFA